MAMTGCRHVKDAMTAMTSPSNSAHKLPDSRLNAGLEPDVITFCALRIEARDLDTEAVVRDILFYNGDTQNVMDTRAFTYGAIPLGVARTLDGNPGTQMDRDTGFPPRTDIDFPLGYRTTHVIVNTPTPGKLSGLTILFRNSIRRPLVTLDLGILADQPGGVPAWRVDLPSLKVSPVHSLPADTHYRQLDLAAHFAPSAQVLDMTRSETLDLFQADVRWEATERGAQPRFTTVTSPTSVKNAKGIEATIDGNRGTKWCTGFTPGLTWLAKLDRPQKIDSYTFQSANDCPKRDPREWRLEGALGDGKWETLDHRKDVPMMEERFQRKTYSVDTAKAYDHYRIVFLRFYHGSFNLIQLSEIQLGDLKLTPSREISLALSGRPLRPGESVAFSCEVDQARSRFGVRLGDNTFVLEDLEKLTVPNGDQVQAQREDGPDPFRQTLVLTRGAGAAAAEFTWRLLGIRHDAMGTTTLPDASEGDLPVGLFFAPLGGGASEIHVNRVMIGALKQALPDLPTAPKWQDLPPVPIPPRYHVDRNPDSRPCEHVSHPYGDLTPEELATFKQAIATYPIPTHNDNNRLTFGDAHATQSLYFMAEASDDEGLIDLLEQWCDSILAWRNGGPNYSIPFYTQYLPNPGLEVCKAHPVWNHFMGRRYVQGKVHYFDDLSAGSAGPCALLFYPKYIAAHPDMWDKPCADGSMTCLEKAKHHIKEAERTLNEYTIKHFADPVSGRIPKPWNRYAELIEACVILEEIYDALRDHDDIFDEERLATYHRVVDAYVEYIFDPTEGYSESVVEHDGKPYTVVNFGYCPTYLEWGSKSEMIWYSGMDFGALVHVYASGRHTDVLSDARTMLLRNTLRYLTYQGRDADGNMKLGTKINGQGPSKRTWVIGHMLAAYLDPSFYDEFIGDMIKETKHPTSFGNVVWIREEMQKRGVVEPESRALPRAVLRVSANTVAVGEAVAFSADQSTGVDLRHEWDFDRDGKPDYTSPSLSHTFTKPGHHFVLLKVTDTDGRIAFDQATITVE